MYYHTTNMGWQCPVCAKVNAPWVAQCPCNGALQTYTYPEPYIWTNEEDSAEPFKVTYGGGTIDEQDA